MKALKPWIKLKYLEGHWQLDPSTIWQAYHRSSSTVASLCRKLEILVGRNPPDAKIVDTLLTPSPQRFQLLCKTFQGFCPELEEELEELKPAPKVTLEEARFRHVMEFCQDAGLFDDGDDVDLLKIKGDLLCTVDSCSNGQISNNMNIYWYYFKLSKFAAQLWMNGS